LVTWSTVATAERTDQRVLVLHSYHGQLNWTKGLAEGIDLGFEHTEPEVQVFHEFLDAKRFPALEQGKATLELLSAKYAEEPPDLIMVSDDPGLMLLVDHRSSLFPETPLVYLGINQIEQKILNIPNATGVFELHSTVETALGALQQTGSRGLIVINDSTETGAANLSGIRSLEARPDAPDPLVVLNDLTPETVSESLSPYPEETPVLLLGQLRRGHREGALMSFQETAETIYARVRNPLYAESVTFLGHGVIGGRVLDAEHHAEKAVELARLVLAKGSAEGVAAITEPRTQWTFDSRELSHFGIDRESLPADSRIIHQKPTFYQQYKNVVFASLAVFAGSFAIIVLLADILRRRTIERRLLRENEKRYRDHAEKLAYQASHDWLTGLVNRYEFNSRLEDRISDPSGDPAVLCYLDLDQFKIVNDTAGHLVGDRMLVEIAKLLEEQIRDTDVLGRLGGDEFGLILKPCTPERARQVCERLIATTRSYRFRWENRSFAVGCSVGVVPIADRSASVTDLLSRADLACYKAKDLGRGRVFMDLPREAGLDDALADMVHVANLQDYLAEGRFFLVGQEIRKIVPAAEEREHFEVLLRFRDDAGSVVSPGAFIPAMERYGAITLLDRWVLKTVVEQAYEWSDDSLIGINISGISLGDERFHSDAVALLRQAGVDPSRFCFEITETAAIAHMDDAKTFVRSMREIGAKFAIDDFGSGLASFGYLRDLDVDYLKIDGNLVTNIASDPNDLEIVKFVNDIAHNRGAMTVAEFVENDATLACLRSIGVDYAQGFGIARPRALAPRDTAGIVVAAALASR